MKTIYFIICIFSLLACDKELIEEFVIDNDYNRSINVQFENMNGEVFDSTITPNALNVRFYVNTGYGNSVSEFDLSRLFKYFTIQSDTIISATNYLDNNQWLYTEYSETHSEYRLIIDSSDFSDN
jgi:hypothetical protein